MKRDWFLEVQRKQEKIRESEQSGLVADSIEVRMALMTRIKSGEITLKQAQDLST